MDAPLSVLLSEESFTVNWEEEPLLCADFRVKGGSVIQFTIGAAIILLSIFTAIIMSKVNRNAVVVYSHGISLVIPRGGVDYDIYPSRPTHM